MPHCAAHFGSNVRTAPLPSLTGKRPNKPLMLLQIFVILAFYINHSVFGFDKPSPAEPHQNITFNHGSSSSATTSKFCGFDLQNACTLLLPCRRFETVPKASAHATKQWLVQDQLRFFLCHFRYDAVQLNLWYNEPFSQDAKEHHSLRWR